MDGPACPLCEGERFSRPGHGGMTYFFCPRCRRTEVSYYREQFRAPRRPEAPPPAEPRPRDRWQVAASRARQWYQELERQDPYAVLGVHLPNDNYTSPPTTITLPHSEVSQVLDFPAFFTRRPGCAQRTPR